MSRLETMAMRGEFVCVLVLVFGLFSGLLPSTQALDNVPSVAAGVGVEGPHISSLNLLLPPLSTHPVRYRLQASGGCFSWSWDHHDILSLEVEYNKTNGCSTSALITSIAVYQGRRATAVHARDQVTGYVLRCEVFVDKISRIQIFHHSVKLDLDGFATLRVRAFDSEENVFSTLIGLQFKWQLLPHPSTGDSVLHRLIHVPLKNAPLNNCDCTCSEIDTQIELEKKGFGSDLYVVQGIRAGQETVTAILKEPDMEELVDMIKLTVAEPVFIEPTSPLHIIPGTELKYRLRTIRHNIPSDILVPSPHYEWFTTNSSVATVDHHVGLLHGKELGVTLVIVQDNRVPGHQQTSTVLVVIPSVMRLYLYPLSAKGVGPRVPLVANPFISSDDVLWHLVVGREYVVQVLVFSEESTVRPLYLTQSNRLELFFQQPPYWDAIPIPEDVASEQGWRNASLIHALSEGYGTFSAHLVLETSLHGKQVFRAEQAVKVCSSIKIVPEFDFDRASPIILPWVSGVSQSYELRVEAGCGERATDYDWTSSDSSVVTVSPYGVVRSRGLGKAVVRVAYSLDPLNMDEIVVEVELPKSVKPLQGLTVEAEVGSLFPAAITLLTATDQYYSACDTFNDIISWSISDGEGKFQLMNSDMSRSVGVFQDEFSGDGTVSYVESSQQSFPPKCASIHFLAVSPGKAVVTAKFIVQDNLELFNASDLSKALHVSWTISAYAPIRLEQVGARKHIDAPECDDGYREGTLDVGGLCRKESANMLLVVGSNMKVILQGGPERWRQGVEFINYCEVLSMHDVGEEKNDVLVVRETEGGGRVYSLTCTHPGNYTLLFHRGNLVAEDIFVHVIAVASLHLICDIPASVALQIDESDISLAAIKSIAHLQWSETRMRIDPVILVNRRTISVTAVALHISGHQFSNFSSLLFRWSLEKCIGLASWEGSDSSKTVLVGSWQKRLVLGNATGECALTVRIEKLKQSFLAPAIVSNLNDVIRERQTSLTDGAKLQLVDMLRLEPNESVLFAHPDAKATFTVTGGSSELESSTNDSNVAVVIQQPSATNNFYLQVSAKGVGIAQVHVRDVGIMIPVSASALVIVADIAWVKCLLREDASLQLHSHMLVKLQAGDSAGHVFQSSQFQFMNVHLHLHDEVLELVSNQSTSSRTTQRISGDVFTIRGGNVGLTSFHVTAQQRSGLEVHTDIYRISVYAPLSIYPSHLTLAPGAQYVITTLGGPKGGFNVQFSSLDDKVATVEGISGRVVAKSEGDTIVHALAYDVLGDPMTKCSIEVQVHVPSSMHLEVKSGRLSVGQEMSIYPAASENMDLLSFWDVCTNYQWSISDEQVLSFHGVDSGTWAVEMTKENTKVGTSSDLVPNGMIEEKMELPADSGFSLRVLGRSAGRATVTVSFTCHYHNGGGSQKPINYKASSTIWVVPAPPLALGLQTTWVLPANYTSSALLPQWKDDLLTDRLPGNTAHNVMYSVMHDSGSSSGLAILEGGRLKTSERTELACVQARDRNTGRSEVAVCIRVAEVAQMTVGDNRFPYHVVELSVGHQEQLTISLRDELGIPFLEAGEASIHQLVVDTNRADVVSVKIPDVQHHDTSLKISVFVQALRQGTALVRICYKGNRHISDFLLVRVGAYLAPQNPVLLLGDDIIFSVIGKSDHGSWSSSNPNIVKVDSRTGKTSAIGEGVATVSFVGSRLATYTSVTVVKVASAMIEAPAGLSFLTNMPRPEDGYKFPVKFRDHQGHDVSIVAKNHVVTYECLLQPDFVGKLVPWHEPGKGKFYCVFWPYSPDKLVSMLERKVASEGGNATFGDSNNLQATVAVLGLGAPYVFGAITTTFIGGFSVLETAIELSSQRKNRTLVRVFGNIGGVLASWSKTNVVDVALTGIRQFGTAGHAIYEVKLLNEEDPFSDKLVFTLPATGQREEIPVTYDPGHGTSLNFSHPFILVAISLAVLIVTLYLFCTRVRDLSGPVHSVPGSATSPAQQRDSLPPVNDIILDNQPNGFQTPLHQRNLSRTPPPQPYTDYVSRTLEHTPYYSRQNLRKFDPSRTY